MVDRGTSAERQLGDARGRVAAWRRTFCGALLGHRLVVERAQSGHYAFMRSACLAALVALVLVAQPGVAQANGADLSTRSGRPGDEIRVKGADWLTCCPSGTPSDPVVIRMIVGQERLVLLQTGADSVGRIAGSFTVPDVEPGTYDLEACDATAGPSGTFCLPEGEFRVLPVSLALTGSGSRWLLPLGVALVVLGVAAVWRGDHRQRQIDRAEGRP